MLVSNCKMKADKFKVSMYFANIKKSLAGRCMMEISGDCFRCRVCKPGSYQLMVFNSESAVDFRATQINVLGQ